MNTETQRIREEQKVEILFSSLILCVSVFILLPIPKKDARSVIHCSGVFKNTDRSAIAV